MGLDRLTSATLCNITNKKYRSKWLHPFITVEVCVAFGKDTPEMSGCRLFLYITNAI